MKLKSIEEVVKIPLTQGFVALVSPEDFSELSKYKWHDQ